MLWNHFTTKIIRKQSKIYNFLSQARPERVEIVMFEILLFSGAESENSVLLPGDTDCSGLHMGGP